MEELHSSDGRRQIFEIIDRPNVIHSVSIGHLGSTKL
jgi:hypothetical protein